MRKLTFILLLTSLVSVAFSQDVKGIGGRISSNPNFGFEYFQTRDSYLAEASVGYFNNLEITLAIGKDLNLDLKLPIDIYVSLGTLVKVDTQQPDLRGFEKLIPRAGLGMTAVYKTESAYIKWVLWGVSNGNFKTSPYTCFSIGKFF